ncbi:MAG: DUF3341 domain-containing protein [Bacteroidales bacterium]|nr:DUF3341 domain-containing protein [Bacteroidales bacterium]
MREVLGYYTKETDLLEGVKTLVNEKITVKDVFSPYPVHGLDKAMKLKRSRLPRVAFIFGALGALLGFLFQAWVFTKSYPINIGGKPFMAIPSFIPVTFECTILFAAIAIVLAYLLKSHLGAGADNKIYDQRATDDHFVIVLDVSDKNNKESEEITTKLKATGAKSVETKLL